VPPQVRRMINLGTSDRTEKDLGEYFRIDSGRWIDSPAVSCEKGAAVKEPIPFPASRVQLFEEVILPHLNAAYNLARWLTRNQHDAQDVVQEAYLRAFRFFDSYRGGDGKAWLLEVVRNTCFTFQRREKRNMSSVVFDEASHSSSGIAPNAEEALVEASKQTILQNCIESLPDAFREVIVMRELEEMSYRQIADIAGLPPGTVMSRLSRARKRLEECAKARSAESAR
jgi:RNA polymerase sigma-70 factor (ECF subfamily)